MRRGGKQCVNGSERGPESALLLTDPDDEILRVGRRTNNQLDGLITGRNVRDDHVELVETHGTGEHPGERVAGFVGPQPVAKMMTVSPGFTFLNVTPWTRPGGPI